MTPDSETQTPVIHKIGPSGNYGSQSIKKRHDEMSPVKLSVRITVVGLFVVMIALNAYQVYRIAFVRHEADFVACIAGATDLRNGVNPYLPTAIVPYNTLANFRPYIYPLFFAWLWIPFTFLVPVAASFAWYAISVAIMFYVLAISADLAGIKSQNECWLAFGIIAVLFVSILQWILMFGHEDLLVLLFLLLGTKYLVKGKSAGGAWFGMAAAGKLMPIVVLPMLIRNWKAMAMAASAIVATCIVIPYFIAGSAIFHYYDYWVHTTLGSEMAKGDNAVHSFALAGAAAQIFGYAQPPMLMKLVCGLLLLAFPMVLLFRNKSLPALLLSFMLIPLCSTRSEPNHLIMLLPGMMLLISVLLQRQIVWKGREVPLSKRATVLGWIALVLVQLMILWGYNAVIPFDTLGMLVVFGVVFWEGMSSVFQL